MTPRQRREAEIDMPSALSYVPLCQRSPLQEETDLRCFAYRARDRHAETTCP